MATIEMSPVYERIKPVNTPRDLDVSGEKNTEILQSNDLKIIEHFESGDGIEDSELQ
jgi:hypothetical protein